MVPPYNMRVRIRALFLWTMEFYDTKQWEQKRESILRRDQYMCQISKRYGLFRQAEVVHHIFPLNEYPEYALCDWNLISITRKKHNELHDRDTDELTETGRELLIRTARKNGIEIPEKYQNAIRKKRHKEFRNYTRIS